MENENQEIERYNTELIEKSNASSFYNEGLKQSVSIAKNNKDNPAKMQMEMDAYIDGTTKEIPSLDVIDVKKPIETVRDSFVKESTKELARKQLRDADDISMRNTFEAAYMAQEAIEEDYPQEAKAVIQSNMFQLLDDDVSAGRLSAQEAIRLLDINNETQVRKMYSKFILDKTSSVEAKLYARQTIIDGTTGNPYVDQLPLGLRIQAINSVEDEYSKLEKREREIIERDEYLTGKKIEDILLGMDAAHASEEKMARERERLRSIAKTKAQLEMINNWTTDDWEPTQRTSLLMEEAERNGVATRGFYEDLLENNQISYKTFREKMSRVNRSMQETMETDAFKQANQEMKAIFGFTDLGENRAYNIAMNTMMRELSALDHIASRAEVEEIKKKATEMGKAFPGYSADEEKNNRTFKFYTEHKYAVHQMDELEKKARDILAQNKTLRRQDYGTPKVENMINAEMQRQLIASGKSKLEAMKMIAEWKQLGKEM